MLFEKLEIYEHITGTMRDYKLTHTFLDVGVVYLELRQATAQQNGIVVAQLHTYDDDPITIGDDAIIINGIAVKPAASTNDDITYWKLS